ncbi:MAG: hypothetical protein H6853_04470 [Rhodospirillales bacterium]|nr:hypothetical protein [Alphaproteobacteria bacterium]USO04524.1 MAG: hypothetical protein H6853_04470 [Rhodospirillales bacterium]
MKILLFAALVPLFASLPVMAQEHISVLTEDSIQAFVDDSAALTDPDNGMSDEDIRSFLDTHLKADGAYKSVITYEIPGYPPQARQVSLNKEDFIQNVIEGRNALEDYAADVRINSTEIEKDGQQANIRTRTTETGRMPFQDGAMVPFEGTSICTQGLSLNPQGQVVLSTADCRTTITILED